MKQFLSKLRADVQALQTVADARAAREADAARPNPVETLLADPAALAAALAWDNEHIGQVTGRDEEERAESLRALLAKYPPVSPVA